MAPLISRSGFNLGFGRRRGGPSGPSFSATGGVTASGISPGNGYTYHVFTSPGTFIVSSGSQNIEYLVIGGGGIGGGYYGGGGGAGGLRSNDPNGGPGGPSPVREPDYSIVPGTYPVVVGTGGGPTSFQPGNYSSFNDTNVNSLGTIRSEGGGGGSQGGGTSSPAGNPGGSGSGGGAGPGTQALGSGNRQAGTSTPVPNQGYPGGQGGSPSGQYNSGGGGGAGGAGGNGDPNSLVGGSFGGPGKACPAFAAPFISPQIPAPIQPRFIPSVGPTGLYAGGGGAHRGNLGSFGDRAGPGGGGGIGKPGQDGCNFTGGGGGGASLNPNNGPPYQGGNGGSGIVIIRYLGESGGGGGGTITYTGYALNKADGTRGAADGSSISASTSGAEANVGGTATFSSGIPYTTLRVIYGNMANGSLGNKDSGAVLSINGSAVTSTGTYGTDGYSASYAKYYDASNGTLNSIGIGAGVSGSHETNIFAIIVDGVKITATGPTYS